MESVSGSSRGALSLPTFSLRHLNRRHGAHPWLAGLPPPVRPRNSFITIPSYLTLRFVVSGPVMCGLRPV